MLSRARAATPITTPMRLLLKAKGIYNVRKASPAVVSAMRKHLGCSAASAEFNLIGENSIQVRRKLNRQLASELAAGTHVAAFAATCDLHDCPRADDIEGMIKSFPAWDAVDWDAPPVASGLDVGLWQA